LSGPILDRIDLSIKVDPTEHRKILDDNRLVEASATVRQRVMDARSRQSRRQKVLNGQLDNQAIKEHAQLNRQAKFLLNHFASKFDLSARSYLKTLKVARTIADLATAEQIDRSHMQEAFSLRYIPPTTL